MLLLTIPLSLAILIVPINDIPILPINGENGENGNEKPENYQKLKSALPSEDVDVEALQKSYDNLSPKRGII